MRRPTVTSVHTLVQKHYVHRRSTVFLVIRAAAARRDAALLCDETKPH
jgi:hypothetical protein